MRSSQNIVTESVYIVSTHGETGKTEELTVTKLFYRQCSGVENLV